MTTATDELRKLLDERGEDYSTAPDGFTTWWHNTGEITAWEDSDGVLTVWGITPEQAIAATLGNSRAERTCRIEWRDDSHDTDAGYERDGAYFCTACGADLPYPLQECWDDYQAGNYEKPFNYCPSCGAKVLRNTPKCSETTMKVVGE